MKIHLIVVVVITLLFSTVSLFAYELEVVDKDNSKGISGCNVSVKGAKKYPNATVSGTTQNGIFNIEGWFRGGNGTCTCINIVASCPGYQTGYLYNDWSCASGGWIPMSKQSSFTRDMNGCGNDEP